MNLIFRCKHIELDKGIWIKEPIIPITLIGPSGIKLNFTAILDCGSDFVLLPLEVADALELEYDKSKHDIAKSYTGNEMTTTKSLVKVKIEKDRQSTEFECRCAIWLNPDQQQEHIILGSTFFEHVRIIFDYPNNKFQIKTSATRI